MSDSTLLIIGAAVALLAVLLLVLARTGRKPPIAPAGEAPSATIAPDEPLPEPGLAVSGLATAELAPAGSPTPTGPPDSLTRMKGLGPKAEATLNGIGVSRYDQIAAWNEADVTRIDAGMGAFKGRIVRDRWVEQARYLAADDVAGFEAVFGKIG